MRFWQNGQEDFLGDTKCSGQEMAEYAKRLSRTHTVFVKKATLSALGLTAMRRSISHAFDAAAGAKQNEQPLPALSEWFYDNRYLFAEQIKTIETYQDTAPLPHVRSGTHANRPRCLAMAIEMARCCAFDITPQSIEAFLNAYQQNGGLSSAELWAFPVMLRIALLGGIASVAKRSVHNIKLRKSAAALCERVEEDMLVTDELIAAYKRSITEPVFIAHVAAILRNSPHAAQALHRLDAVLNEKNQSVSESISAAQAAETKEIILLSSAVTSLRMLVKLDFTEIFENVSMVHANLCKDETYTRMDFESRDYYRRCVADIAKHANASEQAVAAAAIQLASAAGEHAGIYIAGAKREALVRAFGQPKLRTRFVFWIKQHLLLLYIGSIAVSTLVSALLLCLPIFLHYPVVYGIFGFVISIVPIYTVASAVNNRIFMALIKPSFMPRLALEGGIPKHLATMVVVPSLVTSMEDGERILEQLEVYYAANKQENIYFALLSDFKQNKNEVTADDERIIDRMENAVDALNRQYGSSLFFFAQRRRVKTGERYAGWERKRGALIDFCALLHGDDSAFAFVTQGFPRHIKYVITLDADTQLPRDGAQRMVGAMAHPLHRPVVDTERGIVTDGHAVMQPRIEVDVVSAARSHFSLVFSGRPGIDTYSGAVSDVYQDGFGTGIFTGKGIFDLEVYTQLLAHAFPDNAVLSHDLLEGSYLRCALITDVVLMDGYPGKYSAWASRQHRWARGDWQLLPWLKKTVTRRDKSKVKNPLRALSKYQILDNLRRSLSVPLSFLVILLSQTAFYRSAFFWFVAGVLPLFIDSLLDFFARIITIIKNTDKGATLRDAWLETRRVFERAFYTFAFLAYETYLMLDAAVRTVVRVCITRKNLLEWVTSADSERAAKDSIMAYWLKMRAAPMLAAALYALSVYVTRSFSFVAFALFALWFFSPSIAYAISRRWKPRAAELNDKQKEYLTGVALRTWRFFERFEGIGPYGWMPDNVQQSPYRGAAYRTSPTNVAFSMIAGFIAYYFGFATPIRAITMLEKCVGGIEMAEKWNGHLYNWYNIEDLEPLHPRYVSSVDNGNLACYLVVANEALRDMLEQPIAANMQAGLSDVSRESGKQMAFAMGDDIFGAVGALSLITYENDTLGRLMTAYSEYIDTYAGWARTLYTFPQNRIHLYTEYTGKLRGLLRSISVGEYVIEIGSVRSALSTLMRKAKDESDNTVLDWGKEMERVVEESYINARNLCKKVIRLGQRIERILSGMDFSLLYDKRKNLFSIGYNVEKGELSDSYYDLLASEARQAGFIAIAKGDVPAKHWFRLARPIAVAGERRVLLSWSGTMFEYLMPLLIMKRYEHTLLSETYRTAVDLQCEYAAQRRVPWGVSESGFYAFDLQMNYQYKAFGVSTLGMKSGLANETVVTPYAACLALGVRKKAAIANMMRFEKNGAAGKYGFFEAVDYTRRRLAKGMKNRIVKSYMVHHQGMIFAALLNCLHGNKLQLLFHNATIVKATEMLLKEKVPPRSVTIDLGEKEPEKTTHAQEIHATRTYSNVMEYPEAHFLGGGEYTVMLTQYGTGYSKVGDSMITRWYPDCLRRSPGVHIYIKNRETGSVWSAGLLPTCVRATQDRVVFEPHKATFARQVGDFHSEMEVCVSPESSMEIRSLRLKNGTEADTEFSVYCAFSPALCSEREFSAHPAFAELFVQTRVDTQNQTIYAERRGKSMRCALKAVTEGDTELMTDRTAIFGRCNEMGTPACCGSALHERDVSRALCVKCTMHVAPGETECVSFAIAASEHTEDVTRAISTVSSEADAERVFQMAWTHAQVEMRHMRLKNRQQTLLQKIASRTVVRYPSVYSQAEKPDGIETLWKYGISGDLPVVCMICRRKDSEKAVSTLMAAQDFMRQRRVRADLVIIYAGGEEYSCAVRDKAEEAALHTSGCSGNRVLALSLAHLSAQDVATITAASCLVLTDETPLVQQLDIDMLRRAHAVFEDGISNVGKPLPRRLKAFDNGTGGYIDQGKAYCIDISEKPQLPWSNILANPHFGTLISAGGGGYTWAENARLRRLTPFRNDALTDITGEGVLVRNDRTGEVVSVAPDAYSFGKYRVIHGFGYTIFEHGSAISTKATYFVDTELSAKACLLQIGNNTRSSDTYSVFYYAEPAVADNACSHVHAAFSGGALTAFAMLDGGERRMFIAAPDCDVRYTASAHEFFGTPGNNVIPEALKADELSDSDGRGATVLAIQARVKINAGTSVRIPLVMGCGDEVRRDDIIAAFADAGKTAARLKEVKKYWEKRIGGIRVRTRDKAFDTLVNGWLVYQTYTARLFGRTGYFQSGGAFGFRDQLQDVMALLYTDTKAARDHIIKCAAHQFIEGDVLHWWHEPARGVRTKISDDKLFLPYVVCEYVRVTGDTALLDEPVSYLESVPIPAGEHDLYQEFELSDEKESVFVHCARAIESASRTGRHGLPLMGTGDWNDGMDKVGQYGRGESVWMAFFLIEVLRMFSDVCRQRDDMETARKYEKQREVLKRAVEAAAWDGEWYKRAFFDDGTPLGSSASPECKIDLVSQAWAAMSGAVRSRKAFEAAEAHLVMRDEGIIRLLTPSFDKWEMDPGYIKDYLPGLRENGGQYTHAAVWFVIAAAKLRRKDKAFELFQMLNPINHTRTPAGVLKYKGEPYVMAADVYYNAEHKGRAGWTWYTGTAGWMQQAAVIHILGMHIEAGRLSIRPCVPDDFGEYTISYRYGEAEYEIEVDVTPGYQGGAWLSMDGGARQKQIMLNSTAGVHKIFACWQE